MKTHYLFSNRFKIIGWILFLAGLVLGGIYLAGFTEPSFLDMTVFSVASNPSLLGDNEYLTFSKRNVFSEIIFIFLIIGAILVAFSKEKSEDEFISRLRLESLVWATYVNYSILLLTIIFIRDHVFLWVLVVNMFTILFFFLIRFNWVLHKSKRQLRYEE